MQVARKGAAEAPILPQRPHHMCARAHARGSPGTRLGPLGSSYYAARMAKAKQPVGDRYLLIEGRRWRRSDPNIPESLRVELVGELMAARRAVQTALRSNDGAAERLAR